MILAKRCLIICVLLFLIPGQVVTIENENRIYLLQYLTTNLSFDNTTISILDEDSYKIRNITIYFIKVKDRKGNIGTFYLETTSLRIFDHKPDLYEIYNFSKKIDGELFLLMLDASKDEKFDILIQFNEVPDEKDVDAVKRTGAMLQSIEGQFIVAKANKQSIFAIAEMDKVEIIASNIPAKPLNSELQTMSIFKYLPFFALALIFLFAIFYFHWREENQGKK